MRKTWYVNWVPAAALTGLILLAAGCGGAGQRGSAGLGTPAPDVPGVKQTQPAPPAQPATSEVAPAKRPVTLDEALAQVGKIDKVAAYRKAVEANDRKVKMRWTESPSYYQIQVGEDSGPQVTFTMLFLVKKSDGTVTEWDLTKGPEPND